MAFERWLEARGKLIVSCQASHGDAFSGPEEMERFARAAEAGGAGGIRCSGPADVGGIRRATRLPVLAIHKQTAEDGMVLITPTFEVAAALASAGADAIALDCTSRGFRFGAHERLKRIKSELGLPVMADIATVEEAEAAVAAGADFVLSTMRGFTAGTRHLAGEFEPGFIAELVNRLSVPVIAEGRIWSPGEARAAMDAGAWAVVVGTAITRPHEITRRFAEAVSSSIGRAWVAAIDIGATNIKSGLVSPSGDLAHVSSEPTPGAGADAVLARIRSLVLSLIQQSREPVGAVAIATAGWVDTSTGAILHATANLSGWTGTPVLAAVAGATGLPVFVENDAVCAAAGEWVYGEARGVRHALCVTLGTGIGCGAIVEGRLLRGAHGLANMLGHIPLAGSGNPCTCGLTGCFEASAGQAGLSAIARQYESPDAWAAAARGGEAAALEILREYAAILALGLLPAIHLLDPEVVVFSGGITSAGPLLTRFVEEDLVGRSLAPGLRGTSFRLSSAGLYAGVRGAAALARMG